MTDKRNGVPTLRAAAEAASGVMDSIERGFAHWDAVDPRTGEAMSGDPKVVFLNREDWYPAIQRVNADLAAALRTDRDLSARRTRRRRGTDIHAPVDLDTSRGNRHE